MDRKNVGISPVIGIAMMIIITTALAAITGAFALGVVDFNESDHGKASTSIEDNADENRAVVRVIELQNADRVIISVSGQDTELGRSEVGQKVVIGDSSDSDIELEYVEGAEVQVMIPTGDSKKLVQTHTLGE